MLHAVKDLKSFGIRATDGDIGRVSDVLFDDERWTVRYLVVDTGTWLPGRKVLISPFAVGRLVERDQVLTVSLTQEQVERSPDVDTHQPISRRFEAAYARYYGYPFYWGGTGMWGASSYPYPVPGHVPVAGDRDRPDPFAEPAAPVEILEAVDAADVHLRSCDSVRGYTIDATDGEIGHVDDFLIEDETWAIRYAVVSTSNWWFGNKVLISPNWIEAFSWAESKAVINMTRESIRSAPPYDPDTLLERDRETALHEHYGRRMY